MASPTRIANAATDLRLAPQQSLARENHAEQRINTFLKNRAPARQKMQKIRVGRIDLPPVFPDRQSVAIPVNGRLPGIVVLRPQVSAGGFVAELIFLSRTRSLLTRKFRVAISGTIGSRPFDCAFRDQEIEQTSGSPLVAWHADSVAASFFRLDQETGDAKRHRQVVQPDKGLWVHQADGRR
jgi:hypothetical protein